MSNSFNNQLSNWKKKFLTDHVQEIDTDGKFLSGESVVLFAGPPKLDPLGLQDLYPIGLVQDFQLQQSKDIQQIFEIGSRLPILIPGRTQTSASASRILFDGASLMKAAYTVPNGSGDTANPVIPGARLSEGELNQPTAPFQTDEGDIEANSEATGDFFINLASNYFNKPVGLGLAMHNMNRGGYGGVYLERVYFRAHQFRVGANQTVLAESVSLLVTNLVPLKADMIGGGA